MQPGTPIIEPAWAIEPLAWRDERTAAAMLVRAFAKDPLVKAICGTPERRRSEKMWWSFRLAIRAHCLSPEPAWVVRDGHHGIVGLVLVSRYGGPLPAKSDTFFAIRSLWHIGWAAAERAMEAARAIARHLPAPPFLYVRTLGIDPAVQRRGLGSYLLAHALNAPGSLRPAYLETAVRANLQFYARHGFRCIGTFSTIGVPIWRLWRPASVSATTPSPS